MIHLFSFEFFSYDLFIFHIWFSYDSFIFKYDFFQVIRLYSRDFSNHFFPMQFSYDSFNTQFFYDPFILTWFFMPHLFPHDFFIRLIYFHILFPPKWFMYWFIDSFIVTSIFLLYLSRIIDMASHVHLPSYVQFQGITLKCT